MERSETGFLNRTASVGDLTLNYQVYLPRSYKPAKRWPVILFLHGAGERGLDGLRQTQVGLGTAIRWNSSWFPSLVVFPQAPPGNSWSGLVGQAALTALEQSVAEFRGDGGRLYAVGISMGGYGVVELAIQHPDRFAALVPVCGGLAVPPEMPSRRVAGRLSGAYTAAIQRLARIPIWLFHGVADDIVPVTESRRLYTALQRAGADVRYTEYPGVGHNSWDPAFGERELWFWLLKQRRREAGSAGPPEEEETAPDRSEDGQVAAPKKRSRPRGKGTG